MSKELIITQNVNALMNRIWSFVLTAALLTVAALPIYGQTTDCKNPNQKIYNKKPAFCAPDGTRGVGISLVVNDDAIAIPDVRCSCLPIALRYNNPGVLKTPQGGWKTQLRDSAGEPIADSKGHALFGSVEDGIAAWGEWMKRRIDKGQVTTAFQIMSVYAPPDDCVGSIGKPPNCLYGVNPTLEYAEQVAGAINKGPNDELNLDGADAGGRETLYAVFSAIATFEIGSDFCRSKCKISRELFDKAMDSVWGVVLNPCLAAGSSSVSHAQPSTTALTGEWVGNSEPSGRSEFLRLSLTENAGEMRRPLKAKLTLVQLEGSRVRLARARIHCLRIALVSRSTLGGNTGISLYGLSARHDRLGRLVREDCERFWETAMAKSLC